MNRTKWSHIVMKYLTLFLVGYCTYIALEVTWRGYSYILMGIASGFLLINIDQLNNRISWALDLLIQGCIGSIMVTIIELVIGEGLKILNYPPMWDYSNMPLNFDGVICLPFSVVWIPITIFGIFIADAYNYYLFHEEPRPYYSILGHHLTMPRRHCDGE